MIRRQQALDADMEALESKLKDLNSQKEKLGNDLPESKEQIESTLNALNSEWKALNAQQECLSNSATLWLKYRALKYENGESAFSKFLIYSETRMTLLLT